MSANLDLVRSICSAWERGDWGSAEWADPEIEFVVGGEGPAPGVWTGVAGMANRWREFLSAWDDVRLDVEEYRELDDERVLVLARFRGQGKTSGLELGQIDAMGTVLFHVHGGKVTKLVTYADRERALADLGLPSGADSSFS
jgi:ketosteroid isomerase-like protein